MGVAGELKGESFFFGDLQPVGGMGEQDAGAVTIYVRVSQHAPEAIVIGRMPIMHTYDLHAVNGHFFIIHIPDA